MPKGREVRPVLSGQDRDQLISRYDELTDQIVRGMARRPPLSEEEEEDLQDQRSAILQEYYDRLPRVALSRCPFCGEPLRRSFDPWGLDGFWWQHRKARPHSQPEACRHFAVLTGAVNLNSLGPRGGPSECFPGPEVPYVIPRLLELPTMTAVISMLRMQNGYLAYPVAYFSEVPPPVGSLTQSWTRRQYDYRDERGQWCWTIRTDPWDFDLQPWVRRGRLKWIEPEDGQLEISRKPAEEFPYANLPGRREPLIVEKDRLMTAPLPAGEPVNPFSE